MKKIYTLLLLLTLCTFNATAEEGEEIVVPVNPTTGTLTNAQSGTTGNWNYLWTWNETDPTGLTLNCGVNNMTAENGNLIIASGSARTATYTLRTSEGYIITAYSFKFASQSNSASITITPQTGAAVTATGTQQKEVNVSGLNEQSSYFGLADQSNAKITVTDFIVTIRKSEKQPNALNFVTLYETPASATIPYRIPAITQARNGNLIAISDYRYCGNDIGYGRVDLHGRISTDNGKTWGKEFTLVEGTGVSGAWNCGFGDAAVIADSESDSVLMMAVCGNVVYTSSTRRNPGRFARFYSTDNGVTWSDPEDVTEEIFGLFDTSANGALQGAFIGSGRLCQSKLVKVGKHHRIYAPLAARPNGNRILYSDDLGKTWKVLGNINDLPAPNGDEPKCEELPDGSIVLSSRTNGGRYFNVFQYTNVEQAQGKWTGVVLSNASMNGIVPLTNACNGGTLLVPAKRKADGQQVCVLLQSIPFGPNRSNVGIYYKELKDYNTYSCADSIACNWDGRLQVSTKAGSAYSEFQLQQDGSIGFIYEENTTSNTYKYDIVYVNLTREQITNDTYEFCSDFDRPTYIEASVEQRLARFLTPGAPEGAVGSFNSSRLNEAENLLQSYASNPTAEACAALGTSLNEMKVPMAAGWYRIMSAATTDKPFAEPTAVGINGKEDNVLANADQLWHFSQNENGKWIIYGGNIRRYVGRTGNNGANATMQAKKNNAATFDIALDYTAGCRLICTNPTAAAAPALSYNANNRVVAGAAGNAEAGWYLLPVKEYPIIIGNSGFATFFLPFSVSISTENTGEFTLNHIKEILADRVTYQPVFMEENLPVRPKESSTDGSDITTSVPAFYPTLVEGLAGQKLLLLLGGLPEEEDTSTDIAFGKLMQSTVRDGETGRVYVLDKDASADTPAFIHQSPATLHNEAYILVPENLSAAEILPLKPITVGIQSVTAQFDQDMQTFDMQGRRISRPSHGIYIHQGKKRLIQ